jgi:hypothetical protein
MFMSYDEGRSKSRTTRKLIHSAEPQLKNNLEDKAHPLRIKPSPQSFEGKTPTVK